jgi:hypothetical protein
VSLGFEQAITLAKQVLYHWKMAEGLKCLFCLFPWGVSGCVINPSLPFAMSLYFTYRNKWLDPDMWKPRSLEMVSKSPVSASPKI